MAFTRFMLMTLVAGFLFQLVLPWWILVVVGLVLGLVLDLPPMQSLAAGFLGGFLLWGGYAGWLSYMNDGILAAKMGALLGGMGPATPLLVTAMLGGVLAGLGALTGALGRRAGGVGQGTWGRERGKSISE